MSIRSFRDRFGALERASQPEPAVRPASPDWPLPAGGRLLTTTSGETVVTDFHLTGPEVDLARTLLGNAGIAGDVESTIFLDTETTGLSGGTGTHVFLVGLGRFQDGGFTVRQYFMRHPGEELALLEAVDQEARSSTCLISYNGRTFDVPLLETRYRMHHHRWQVPDLHIDLLHPVRSVWKHRLPSCSLGTVEEQVLGVRRVDDAPGWMIPQLYFSWLQHRHIASLENVFRHNRQDIISLARLAGLVHAYQAGLESPAHPADRLGVALIHLRMGHTERALPVVEEIAGSPLVPAELRFRAVREMSAVLKRSRRYSEALPIWESGLSDSSRAIRMLAAEELAKYFEHRLKDHRAALQLAKRAADGARLAGDPQATAAFERRATRLMDKIRRADRSTWME